MKKLFGLGLILGLMSMVILPVLAQDCEDELGCVVVGTDDPIVIGTMLTTSGATSFLGEDSLGAVEIAVMQRDGMLLDHEIEVVNEDSLCSAEGGQAAAQRMVSDETVLGVIGTNCSGAAAGAMPIISDAGFVMLSPSNTAPTLTSDDVDAGGTYLPGYFRTAHNDLFQGRLAAQFAYNVLGATTLATIHDGDPYTEGLQGAMADAFMELGGEVVFQGAITKGDTDMTAILTEVAAVTPDVLYFPLFEPESNFIAAQVIQTPGLEEVVMMTADGSFVASFPGNTGDAALGVYQSGPSITGEAYDAFIEVWKEEIGEDGPPSGFHAHAYDATNILLNAVEAVAVVGDDGSLTIGRQALRDEIAATTDYEGLTGTLTCQTESPFNGDCATGEGLAIFEITQAEMDGGWPPAAIYSPADAASEEE